jgi:hypothetical protein
VASGGAAVVEIVECVRHAAELDDGTGRDWARVQSDHSHSRCTVVHAEQVVRR